MPPKFIKMGIMWRPCLCIEDLIKQVRPAAGTAGGRGGEGMGPCECVGFCLETAWELCSNKEDYR